MTAARNVTQWMTELVLSTIGDGVYTVRPYANDSVDNLNNSASVALGLLTFRLDRTPPNVSTFLTNTSGNNASNFSNGVIQINVTLNDSTTTVTTVTFALINSRNSTEFNITPVKSGNFWNATLVLSTMSEGLYTIRVDGDDTVGNRNFTVSNLSFTLDRTGPNVTGLTWNNFTYGWNLSAGLSEGALSLNATINDSLTRVISVTIGINSTNGTEFNVSAAVFGGRWNTTINLSRLTEGAHSFRIYANDTVLNMNNSEINTLVIDRTKPTVTVTCAPSSPSIGETVICTCTSTDSNTGVQTSPIKFEGDDNNEQSTVATASAGTSSVCRVQDFAGNIQTATGSWNAGTEVGTGGGSGGGSGGGVSSGVVGAFEKKVWTSINAGETATVPIENGVIGVTEVSFSVAKTTYGASMEIKKLASLPSTVSSFSKKSYRTLEITQINVEKALKDIAVVKFKVEKAWLVDNKLEKAQVALHRYNNKQWNELPTSVGEDDGTYVYYSATTPGFSYFVIGEKTGKTGAAAAAVSEAVAPVVSEELVTEELEETAATTVEEAVEPSTPGSKLWLVPVIVGLVLVGLLYWYWKRK